MRTRGTYALASIGLLIGASVCQAEDTANGFPRKITIRGVTFEVATPAELKTKGFDYAYPPAVENAAIDYIQAMNALHEAMKYHFPGNAYLHVLKNPWTGIPELTRWLDKHEEVCRYIYAGAAKPQCVFPIHNARYSFEIRLPHLAGLRSLSRFMIVQAKRRAYEDDYAGAAQDLFVALRLAEQYRKPPFLIGGLVDIALQCKATDAIGDMVLRDDWPEDLLRQTAARLATSQKTLPQLTDALRGERWSARDMVKFFVKSPRRAMAELGSLGGGAPKPSRVLDPDGRRVRVALAKIILPDRTMLKHVERYYDRLEAIGRLPSVDAARILNENFEVRALQEIPPWDILSGLLLPALSPLRMRYIVGEAHTSLARGVVAIKLFKIKHGRWPKHLAEVKALTQPDLCDPFTGRPLICSSRQSGWLLYSVGKNLADNGGDKRKDIVVRYPPPAGKPFRGK